MIYKLTITGKVKTDTAVDPKRLERLIRIGWSLDMPGRDSLWDEKIEDQIPVRYQSLRVKVGR